MRIGQQLLQHAVHAAGVAPTLRGLLAFYRVELLQDLYGDRQVVVFKFEDRLGVVQEDVGIEHIGLHLTGDLLLLLRTKAGDRAQIFHFLGKVDNL
ncbi:MAG: hypothetical protein BWX86_01934 [Verrucomicrobia bacterium ADurb.Bin122]|nr:MAG: hypothetical protein BWX86_01934 [Verrucomicrobia bacterium ADurb.Bin122]